MTKMRGISKRLAISLALAAANAAANAGDAWPQLQHDARHTGYSPEAIESSNGFVVGWSVDFSSFTPPEHIGRCAQVIADAGRLFVPTLEGNLYALNPADGKTLWKFVCGEGIMHTAGAAGGLVFAATLEGGVFAVDAETGAEVWRWHNGRRTGFSAAVCLAEGRVFIGGRGGDFHALDQAAGMEDWSYEVPAPIFQTAACDEGRVYFAAEDMRCYCLSAKDGAVQWKSEKLPGASFRDYYPLIHGNTVFLESAANGPNSQGQSAFPLAERWGREKEFETWLAKYGPAINKGVIPPAAQQEIDAAYNRQANAYEEKPELKLRFALDQLTGREAATLPLWQQQVMCGAPQPSCVDRDGMLVMPVTFFNAAWARFDFQERRIVDLLYTCTPDKTGSPGTGNPDEGLNLSAAGPLIFTVHAQEGNAHYTGVFNLDTRVWHGLREGVPSCWGNHPMVHNAQCGNNAASVAWGAAYHQAFHTVHNWRPRVK